MFMQDQLAAIYDALGDTCAYKASGEPEGAPSTEIKATLSSRPADVLGGEQISTHYEVRVPSASVGGAVLRGATFAFDGTLYQATAHGQPLVDRGELLVPVKRV